MIFFSQKWMLWAIGLIALFVVVRLLPVRTFFSYETRADLSNSEVNQQEKDVLSFGLEESFLTERPLFDASRKPPQARATVVVKKAPVIKIVKPRLTGIMTNRQGVEIAYLRFDGQKTSKKVKVGDVEGPWEINAIENGRVVLTHDKKEFILQLNNEKPAADTRR